MLVCFLGLGATILGLHTASFAILVLATSFFMMFPCCIKNDNIEENEDFGCLGKIGTFMMLLYPVAGKRCVF